jgi:serine protease Do
VARLVGSYTNGDIAVIKIDKTGLQAAEIADSDKILQGETCYAVGNPEGRFSGSISDGIVSALDRTITVQVEESSGNRGNSLYDMFYGGGTYVRNIQLDVLQMTAAVSPGNSGGALFNDRGQLIGIVSAKSSQTDSEGLGFAIPSNNAMEIASQLIANGT